MIISHSHRYVFVEPPRTRSTAVRRELRELYAGTPILHKHSTQAELRRQATPDQLESFVSSTVRNSLDDAVSRTDMPKPSPHVAGGYVALSRPAQASWDHRRPRIES